MDSDILDLSFLNKIDPLPLIPDKGVTKYLIKSGDPLIPGQKLPQKGSKAYIKLEGRKIDGSCFDRCKNINEIRKINVYSDKYIEGIHIAVSSMAKNEIAWFKIEPRYHFFGNSETSFNDGDQTLNKNDPLLYKIEVIDYKSTTLDIMDFEGRVEVFEESRERGKELFKAQKFDEALKAYLKSIFLIRNFPNNLRESLTEEQRQTLRTHSTALFSNAALCKIQMKAWYDALKFVEEGQKVSPLDVKLIYRKAQCHLGIHEFLKAKEGFHRVLELDPENKEAIYQLKVCEAGVKQEKMKENRFYANIIKKMPEEEKKENFEKKKKEFLKEKGLEKESETPEIKETKKGISLDELEKGIIIDANDPSNIFTKEEEEKDEEYFDKDE